MTDSFGYWGCWFGEVVTITWFFLFWFRGKRFALVVVGRAGKMFESRKNPKPEKCLSKPQTPKNPLHAFLGAVC